jgi:hypothetical protein
MADNVRSGDDGALSAPREVLSTYRPIASNIEAGSSPTSRLGADSLSGAAVAETVAIWEVAGVNRTTLMNGSCG